MQEPKYKHWNESQKKQVLLYLYLHNFLFAFLCNPKMEQLKAIFSNVLKFLWGM